MGVSEELIRAMEEALEPLPIFVDNFYIQDTRTEDGLSSADEVEIAYYKIGYHCSVVNQGGTLRWCAGRERSIMWGHCGVAPDVRMARLRAEEWIESDIKRRIKRKEAKLRKMKASLRKTRGLEARAGV